MVDPKDEIRRLLEVLSQPCKPQELKVCLTRQGAEFNRKHHIIPEHMVVELNQLPLDPPHTIDPRTWPKEWLHNG